MSACAEHEALLAEALRQRERCADALAVLVLTFSKTPPDGLAVQVRADPSILMRCLELARDALKEVGRKSQ